MSWLFAAVAERLGPHHLKQFQSVHASALQSFSSQSLYVAVGGLEETARFHLTSPSPSEVPSGIAVVGTGIRLSEGFCEFLTTDEWAKLLSSPSPDLSSLDGHFVALRWKGDTLEAWTDQIGLRTLYAAHIPEGHIVSTRLDWVARASGCSAIDVDQIGSSWLLTNQMAYTSQVHGVSRIGPGGVVRCTPRSLTFQSSAWTPEFRDDPTASMMQRLEGLLAPRIESPRVLSLGLSGGFDCRLLLALLCKRQNPFVLHSFGHPQDPDVVMAKRIAEGEGLAHAVFTGPPVDGQGFLARLQDYVAQVGIIAPASLLLKVQYYPQIHQQQRILIDGGYGEISRRQMGNRLLRRGPGVLRRGNPEDLFRLFRARRPSIFTREVEERMTAGARRELADVWHAMPPAKEIGAENFVDLLSIRTRVANNGAPAQQWIDSQIVNYMPYAQPSFLREVFRTALRERRNGRLHRKLIRDVRPSLTSYPLTKEGVLYPYSLGTVPGWICRATMRAVGKKWVDDSPHTFLHHIREYVQDVAHSDIVRTCSLYDYRKVRHDVDSYYAGSSQLVETVDWWLAFELWRRSLHA
jgi:hypothetical protein